MPTTKTPGARLRKHRLAAGYTLNDAWAELREHVPPRYMRTVSTLQRMESGADPEEKWNGVLVVGLARLYDCEIADLSKQVADELAEMDLLCPKTRGSAGRVERLEPLAA